MREPVATTRTNRPTSGYARYIGRVGGLAFALGVGTAVLSGTAVAWADTSGPTGGSGASESSSSSSHHPGTDTGPAKSDSEADTDTADTDSDDEAATAADDDEADENESAADADQESESHTSPDIVEKSPGRKPAWSARRAEARVSAQRRDVAPAAAAAVEPSPFDTFFSNQTPTLAYDQGDNTVVAGHIEGDLHPEDPDSTRLRYTATKPAGGTVAIDSDGTFVYTPGATYTGQDRFDVSVSDARSGFHIHGSAGLLSLVSFGLLGNSGHQTTETVFLGFERAVVASGLDAPVDFRWLPDGRILVAEKGGAIKVVENGTVHTEPLIALSVDTFGERGISGLAVDPQFTTNGYIYVSYTTSAINDRLSRFTVIGNTAALGSEKLLLESIEPAAGNHHGGALGFGPDGKLYWGKGDNGSGSNAQDLTNIHGKILRLNPDGSTPSDNPSLGSDALPQIYAYGLRNPFRLTFTPDGKLLVADVGQAAFEELDLVTAGGNYGWPDAEGSCTSDCTGKINPIYTYPHGGGAAFTSVLVYNGSTFGPGYLNKVFIADTVQGWIKVLTCTPEFTSCGNVEDFDPQGGATVVLAQGPDDHIYQLTYSPGTLVRIAPAGGSSSAAAGV